MTPILIWALVMAWIGVNTFVGGWIDLHGPGSPTGWNWRAPICCLWYWKWREAR